jgi:hypothetical protein
MNAGGPLHRVRRAGRVREHLRIRAGSIHISRQVLDGQMRPLEEKLSQLGTITVE